MYNHVFQPLPTNFIEFGNFTITYYALAILVGILVALWVGYKEIDKLAMNADDLTDGFSWGLIYAIIGARLYYVFFDWTVNPDSYKSIIDVIAIWNGGLAIHGAIIAVAIFMYFYTKRRNLNIFKFIEIVVPGFLIGQSFGRWGNFMNQEAHGPVVPGATLDARREFLDQTLHLPKFIVDQMYLKPTSGALELRVLDYYHPTFLYESIWNIIGLILVFFVFRKIKKYWIGDVLSFYLIWYGIGRFFIEAMRTDPLMMGNTGIRFAQLISVVMILAGVVWFFIRRKIKLYPVEYRDYVQSVKDNAASKQEEVNEEE